jgi:hypothetical protein
MAAARRGTYAEKTCSFPGMPLWLDLLFLGLAVLLWTKGGRQLDDVVMMLMRILAVAFALVVLLGGRLLLLEIALLLLVLWLPSVRGLESGSRFL